MVLLLVILLLFSSLAYVKSRSSFNHLLKKVIFPFSITLISVAILSGCTGNTALELEEETEKNVQLMEENTVLETTHADLLDEYSDLESKLDKAMESTTKLENENEDLQSKNKDLSNKNQDLSTKNKDLSKSVDTLKNDNKQLQNKLDEKIEASKASEKSNSSKSQTSSTSPNSGSSTSSQNSTSENAHSSEDCLIKGSVNKIYHVPGSTYYSRTKNVVQWFCSVEEAKSAGYRAPEK